MIRPVKKSPFRQVPLGSQAQAAGVSWTTMSRYLGSGTITSSCFRVRTRSSFNSSCEVYRQRLNHPLDPVPILVCAEERSIPPCPDPRPGFPPCLQKPTPWTPAPQHLVSRSPCRRRRQSRKMRAHRRWMQRMTRPLLLLTIANLVVAAVTWKSGAGRSAPLS